MHGFFIEPENCAEPAGDPYLLEVVGGVSSLFRGLGNIPAGRVRWYLLPGLTRAAAKLGECGGRGRETRIVISHNPAEGGIV